MWKTPMYDNSKVTVELRELIENGFVLFDFDYPSFYEGQAKKDFEQKVIDHYYFRQIGQETPARFKHYFKTRMREIMPYFISLYESVELMKNVGDPFQAYDLTETYEEERANKGKLTGSTSDTSSSEMSSEASRFGERDNTNQNKFSDTPQGDTGNLDDGYLTNYTKIIDTTSDSDESSSTGSATASASGSNEQNTEDEGTMKYTLTRKGNIGVQPLGQEINAYRSALIDVDTKVIAALNDLFILIY